MDKKTTDIVAYITWIGWIVAFLAGDKEASKFHLNQSLVIWLGFLISTAIGFIPVVGFVSYLINVFLFVCFILGLVYAIQGQEKEVPLLGTIKLLN